MLKKNLLERAKPELLKAIAQYKVDYPNTAGKVEDALKEVNGVIFLKYGIVVELSTIAHSVKLPFELSNPWEWFADK